MSTQMYVEDEHGVIGQAGDVGGDIQISDSWSRRWIRAADPTDPLDTEHGVVDAYVYLANDQYDSIEPQDFVQVMWIWTLCTDLEDVGGSEVVSDIRFQYIREDGDFLQGEPLDPERIAVNLHEGDLDWFLDKIGH